MFASYYQDHMVLQRAPQRAGVWGYAALKDIGSNVTVTVQTSSSLHVTIGVVQRGK